MLFYKGAKIYNRLNSILTKGFVVGVDRGDRRFFLNFKSLHCFEEWYRNLADDEKTINEVVLKDRRKLIIDIDDDPHVDLSMFDFERHVESRIHEVFACMDIGTPEVIVYRMVDEHGRESKLSYHAVVSNFSFDARTCMGLCMIISSGQVWEKCVDTGIYKSVQSIRMEGSTKFGMNSWKRACTDAQFRRGVISNVEDTACSDFLCGVRFGFRANFSNLAFDTSQFRAGKQTDDYVPLYRVKPGFCPQCRRTHDRENAAIVYRMGRPAFMCWRFTAASVSVPATSHLPTAH